MEEKKPIKITRITVEKFDGHKYTPIMYFSYKERSPLIQLLIDMIVTICRKEGYNHIYETEMEKD